MFCSKINRAVSMMLVAALMIVVSAGINADQWDTAELIEIENDGASSYPDVGFDGAGNAFAVWNYDDGSVIQIMANRYIRGTGWGDAYYLTAGIHNALSSRIAVDPEGNAVAVWRQYDGVRYNIVSRYYNNGTGWGPAEELELDDGEAFSPRVGIDASGNAIAVWPQFGGAATNIYSNRYTAGTGWGSAELVQVDDTKTSSSPEIAVAPDGVAFAVWHQLNLTIFDIWANRYDPDTGWGTAVLVEDDQAVNALDPSVDVDASGNAVVAWRQYLGSEYNVMSNRYTEGVWGTAEHIEEDTGVIQPKVSVAIDDSGNAAAVWQQWDGDRYNIISNRYTPVSGWGTAQEIDYGDGGAETAHVDMDASGNVFAVWRQYDGVAYSVYSNIYMNGIGWSGAEVMELGLGSADVPRISVDAFGNAVVVWYQTDGYRFNIWSNRFVMPDTTPPELTVSAPVGGTTDLPTIRVSGTTEPKAVVTVNGAVADVADDGSFWIDISLFPGINDIEVISKDASGNSNMVTRTVSYNYTVPGLIEDIVSLLDMLTSLEERMDRNLSNIDSILLTLKEGSNLTAGDIISLRENITELKDLLNSSEGEEDSILNMLSYLEERLNDTLDDMNSLKADQAELEDGQSDLEAEQDTLGEKIDSIGSDDNDELRDDIDSLRRNIILLSVVLIFFIIMGTLLFLILIVLALRKKTKEPIYE